VAARVSAGALSGIRRRPAAFALAAAVVLAFVIGVIVRPVPPRATPPSELDQVRSVLERQYYRRLSSSQLASPSIPKLIASLHDRYTTYLTPAEYLVARRQFAAGYGGIGITVAPTPDGLIVRRASVGAVHAHGIRPGDVILAVNGKSTKGMAYREAVGRILGAPGTTVRLRIQRGLHTLDVVLKRRQFDAHPVHATLDGKVGVVRISAFVQGSAGETRAAVRRLRSEGATAYAIDLRSNPGGLLDQAVQVASLFLRDGSTIVSLAGAHRPLRTFDSKGDLAVSAPLAVLVNHRSASASEVVAGALKDYARATIIGASTFGKSLVQQIYQLPSGAALKLTVARYLTPAGYVISHGGIQPDIRSSHAVAAALRFFSGRRS
jgi:carboxyl-terminal processing protease